MAHRRFLARLQRREIDAEASDSQCIPERALLARYDTGAKWLGVSGRGSWLDRGRVECGLLEHHDVDPSRGRGPRGSASRRGSAAKKVEWARNQSEPEWYGGISTQPMRR